MFYKGQFTSPLVLGFSYVSNVLKGKIFIEELLKETYLVHRRFENIIKNSTSASANINFQVMIGL